MLWGNLSYQAKRAQLLSEFNSKLLALCLWLDLSDFFNLYAYKYLKFYSHYILEECLPTYIVKYLNCVNFYLG